MKYWLYPYSMRVIEEYNGIFLIAENLMLNYSEHKHCIQILRRHYKRFKRVK